ncbi:MAG: TonB-dependent receptor [Pseudohongiellaceae bacterium]
MRGTIKTGISTAKFAGNSKRDFHRPVVLYGLLIGVAGLTGGSILHAQEAAQGVEEVVVLGRQEFLETQFQPDRTGSNVDVSRLMSQIPGGSANANGPLTGQIQYRGMSGPRINVRVDGMLIHGGGPNWMAPPLQHIPAGLMEQIVVEKGVASISTGGGIGGAATARWKKPDFAISDEWEWSGDTEFGASSVDHGTSLSGVFGLSSDTHRFFVMGSRDEGEDYRSGEGRVAATRYRRDTAGFGYGLRLGDHELDFDFRRMETKDSGTPSLPMDIDWFDTNLWNARYRTMLGETGLELRLYGSDIDHGMSNYLLRPAPDFSSLPLPPFQDEDRRFVAADSQESGFKLTVDTPLGTGTLASGLEGKFATHNATVSDPDAPAFFVENFNRNEVDTLTAFSEWSTRLAEDWYLETGASLHRVETSAEEVDAMPARMVDRNPEAWPMGTPPRAVWMLRESFNNGERSHRDTLLDWVVKGRYQATDTLLVELAAARKERAPMYQERYLWIPLEANAGLGDGNNYVGDPGLRPETSHQIELGLDFELGNHNFSPRFYYREVDNYIQGVPATRPMVVAVSANANGDPTPLRFANTEASFRGMDLEYGIQLADSWRLEGTASLTRAEREDVNDPLYRISPDTLRTTLRYDSTDYSISLQQVLVARQDRVSATNTRDPQNGNNRHEETPGYGLTNLYLDWFATESLTVTAGLENALDRQHTDHLTGFNRVLESQVPVGMHLPGQGRNGFARMQYRW